MISMIISLMLSLFTSSAYDQTLDSKVITETTMIYLENEKNLQKDSGLTGQNVVNGSTAQPETVTSNTYKQENQTPRADTQIKPVHTIRWGDKSKAAVSLTFDDGFDRSSIKRTLDTLKTADLKCTFFIVGNALRKNQDLWKRAVEEGHQICNHTNSHNFLSGASEDTVKKEIEGWEAAVKDVLGEEYLKKMKKEFPYFRFPGGIGDSNEKYLKVLAEHGYIPIGWSVETCYDVLRHHVLGKEPAAPIAREVTNHVVDAGKKGSIVLLHFNIYDTLGLGETIKKLQDKGLEIKQLSEFLKGN